MCPFVLTILILERFTCMLGPCTKFLHILVFILRHLETKIPFLFGEIMTCNYRKCKCLSFCSCLDSKLRW